MLENRYKQLCEIPSDINEHLPILKKYAEDCKHITEMGTRYMTSTVALLAGSPDKLVTYDIIKPPEEILKEILLATNGIIEFLFVKADVINITIEETDLLFIDTLHNYNQLQKELELHHNNVRKYIIFHDTTSFEFIGESYTGSSEKGIWSAIEEFLEAKPNWKIKERFFNNNGLTIIEKH